MSRRRLTSAFAALMLSACATTRGRPVSAPGELAYRISRPATPRAIDLEIRRVREGPAAFTFSSPGAVGRVRAELADGKQVELSVPSSGELDVPNDWAVLRYRLLLDDVHRSFGSADLSWGLANETDLLVPGAAWLLRPRVAVPGLTATISSDGPGLLLPWEPRADGRWEVSAQDLIDSGFHALGGRRCFLTVGQGKLEVALLGAVHPLGDEAICEWVRGSAAELLQVRTGFPVARVTIAIVPVLSNEASPFGRILPSTPRSLGFLIGVEARGEDFAKDWVALHELLHLVHPPFAPKELWLTEGIATLYTEVARARSKRHSPEKAWEELLEGFDQAAAEASGMRMEEVIRDGGTRLRATAWAGVLFLLSLDLELRLRTGGRRSLDDVLDVLSSTQPMTLAQFGAHVDAVSGPKIFDDVLHAHRIKPAFFPLRALLDQLGVRRADGKVSFEAAPRAGERDALMRAKVRAEP